MVMQKGWINRPADVEKTVGKLMDQKKTGIIQAGHPIRGTWDKKTSHWAWRAEEKVIGHILKSWTQKRGVCVSKGNGRGGQDTLLIDVATGKDGSTWPGEEVASEPVYALSRVEIGGGQISGDGSVGAWAAKALMDFGLMFRKVYTVGSNTADLTKENDEIACRWGAPGVGLPNWMEPIAKEHPVKDVALVDNFDDASDILGSDRVIAVCSNQGFTMRRQANGVCAPSGSWPHCMLFRGILVLKGGRIVVPCQNSWDDYLGGTLDVETENDGTVTIPEGCFLVDAEVANRMLRAKDSFAMDGAVGFAPRKLVWNFIN